jgi:hypothetical protein
MGPAAGSYKYCDEPAGSGVTELFKFNCTGSSEMDAVTLTT